MQAFCDPLRRSWWKVIAIVTAIVFVTGGLCSSKLEIQNLYSYYGLVWIVHVNYEPREDRYRVEIKRLGGVKLECLGVIDPTIYGFDIECGRVGFYFTPLNLIKKYSPGIILWSIESKSWEIGETDFGPTGLPLSLSMEFKKITRELRPEQILGQDWPGPLGLPMSYGAEAYTDWGNEKGWKLTGWTEGELAPEASLPPGKNQWIRMLRYLLNRVPKRNQEKEEVEMKRLQQLIGVVGVGTALALTNQPVPSIQEPSKVLWQGGLKGHPEYVLKVKEVQNAAVKWDNGIWIEFWKGKKLVMSCLLDEKGEVYVRAFRLDKQGAYAVHAGEDGLTTFAVWKRGDWTVRVWDLNGDGLPDRVEGEPISPPEILGPSSIKKTIDIDWAKLLEFEDHVEPRVILRERKSREREMKQGGTKAGSEAE